MDQSTENTNKEQVFSIAQRNQWGVCESSVTSFVLNTFINDQEMQTSMRWQNLQMTQNVLFTQIQKGF